MPAAAAITELPFAARRRWLFRRFFAIAEPLMLRYAARHMLLADAAAPLPRRHAAATRCRCMRC